MTFHFYCTVGELFDDFELDDLLDDFKRLLRIDNVAGTVQLPLPTGSYWYHVYTVPSENANVAGARMLSLVIAWVADITTFRSQ